MADLIARLTSFINLQKTAQVSVPGIVMAIGLVVWYYAFEVKPFSGSFPVAKKAALPALAECTDLESVQTLESGALGRLTEADYLYLQKRQTSMLDCSQKLQAAVVIEQNRIARYTAEIAAHQKAADDFNAQYVDLEKKGNALAAHYRQLGQKELQGVDTAKIHSQEATSRVAAYTSAAGALDADRKAIIDRLKASEQDSPFTDFITKLTDRITYVLILGLVIGLVLDPLTQYVIGLAYTDGRIQRLNLKYDGDAPVPVKATRAPEDNVNYMIGLGLITTADVEAMRNRYGISAQFGMGLILPLVVLFSGLGMFAERYPQVTETVTLHFSHKANNGK